MGGSGCSAAFGQSIASVWDEFPTEWDTFGWNKKFDAFSDPYLKSSKYISTWIKINDHYLVFQMVIMVLNFCRHDIFIDISLFSWIQYWYERWIDIFIILQKSPQNIKKNKQSFINENEDFKRLIPEYSWRD